MSKPENEALKVLLGQEKSLGEGWQNWENDKDHFGSLDEMVLGNLKILGDSERQEDPAYSDEAGS